MATKEVKVPIPQSMIDEAAAGAVSRLERKVKRLEGRVAELEKQEDIAKNILKTYRETRDTIAMAYDLYTDYPEDW